MKRPLMSFEALASFVALAAFVCLVPGCATPSESTKSKEPQAQTAKIATWSRPHFSPDGTHLVAVRNERDVYEFALPGDLTGRDVAVPLDTAQGNLIDLTYSADGQLLVLYQLTNSLMVWNAHKSIAMLRRALHSSVIGGLLSHTGERAVVYFQGTPAKTNTPVALINWNAGGNIIPLPEHQGISCLAFSGDGQRLATVDATHVSRIWNADTGTLLLTFPTDNQKGVGIALDEKGETAAVAGTDTTVYRIKQQQSPFLVSVPNAAPKTTTTISGAGLVALQVGLYFFVGGNPTWDPHWFKAAPTVGLCLSRDGRRVAIINPAPNLKGEFQIRFADALTGSNEIVRGLSPSFLPWGIQPDSSPLLRYHFFWDRTAGQPVFSPDGRKVAIPGNGVRLLDCADSVPPNDLWLAKCKPTPEYITSDWHESHYFFRVEPVQFTSSVSPLARAAHRRVCLEPTVNASGRERWEIPLMWGMKKIFVPSTHVSIVINQSLKGVWQACGQEVVLWGQELTLCSTITAWQLDWQHPTLKPWDLTATIEVEVILKDAAGAVLHGALYKGTDHQTRLWEPSDSFIATMHARALNACMARMKNDSRWEQVLGSGPANRSLGGPARASGVARSQ